MQNCGALQHARKQANRTPQSAKQHARNLREERATEQGKPEGGCTAPAARPRKTSLQESCHAVQRSARAVLYVKKTTTKKPIQFLKEQESAHETPHEARAACPRAAPPRAGAPPAAQAHCPPSGAARAAA